MVICESEGNRIIAAIEILSPWNKTPGNGRDEYLKKRKSYAASSVNLIEIDQVRTGNWIKTIGPYRIPRQCRTTYRVTVNQPELTGPLLYPIPLAARLPKITVPLRARDPVASLDLQILIERAYEMGSYNRIDYSGPCEPPPADAEAVWAKKLLDKAKKR